MTRPRFPDAASSRAVLIGVSHYESGELPPLPAVRANLADLRAALTDPDVGTVTGSGCRVLGDDAVPADVGSALAAAGREADDLLLVYYAGHGVLDVDGVLHLALRTTSEEQPGWTAVSINLIKRELGRARARTRVLVVDCCFSGRAVEAMAAPAGLVAGQLRLTGGVTLASGPANEPSRAPVGWRHTAFTGALLSALANPEPLTLNGIYRHTDATLDGLGLPRPRYEAVDSAQDLALVRGPAARPEPPESRPTAGSQPGLRPEPAPATAPDPGPSRAAPHRNEPEAAPSLDPEPTSSPATAPEPAPSPTTPRRNEPEAAPSPHPEPTPSIATAPEPAPSPTTPHRNEPEAAPNPHPDPTRAPATAPPTILSPAPPAGRRAVTTPPGVATSAPPEPAASFALESGRRPAVAKAALCVPAGVGAAVLSWISFTDPFRNAGPGFWDITIGALFGLFFAVVAVSAAVVAVAGLRSSSAGWTSAGFDRTRIVLLGPGGMQTVPWQQIARLAVTRRAAEPPTVVLVLRPAAALPAGVKARNGRVVLGRCRKWSELSAAARRVAPPSVAVDRGVRKLPR
ncbi:caspase, EACC1-associated type [Amycolatopsis sp. lyj-109]|uniref:caspase, EACC1-associated type n=1 Tax=Amycolatopsis sp. lyj-109 TaxID=2789287 RepID=UPI003978C06A